VLLRLPSAQLPPSALTRMTASAPHLQACGFACSIIVLKSRLANALLPLLQSPAP
jgi:hypothetical protein